MKAIYTFWFLFLSICIHAQPAKDYALLLNTQSDNSGVLLKWQKDTTATQHIIYRRSSGESNWTKITTLSGAADSYYDGPGNFYGAYEYCIRRKGGGNTRDRYGYAMFTSDHSSEEKRGHMLLVTDENYKAPLAGEITRLIDDLEGDGWMVTTSYIKRSASVRDVKSLIDAQPVKPYTALYLLGHIPVPYSGDIYPDGHRPDHRGAWPADVFYGTDISYWTDTQVDHDSAASSRNHNRPGDGKFDQDYVYLNGNDVKLEIGRVDLTQMPAFGKSDTVLTMEYLRKAHAFKTGAVSFRQRALIDDHFGIADGEAFASNAWNNFTALFGDSVSAGDYIPTLKENDHLFAYGCGPGSYTSAGGVATTADFAGAPVQAVFTGMFGSYFGDWDNENNLLRAPLCSGPGLVSIWDGRPYWHLHPLNAGKHIGYIARVTQGNYLGFTAEDIPTGYDFNYFPTYVHTALMGDPSLRIHYIRPPSGISATLNPDKTVRVTFDSSASPRVEGYSLYRKGEGEQEFTLLTDSASEIYTDNAPPSGVVTYMVRARRKEITASGNYKNLSLGIKASVRTSGFDGFSDGFSALRFSIYPNPSQGTLMAETGESALLEMADATGRVVHSQSLTEGLNRVQGNYAPGIYFISIRSGNKQAYKKVLID